MLQPGDCVLIRNMTPRCNSGKVSNSWEFTVHTVVRQVSKDIPVYEFGPEKGKGIYIVIFSSHLSLETSVQPRARKIIVKDVVEVEQSEEGEDADEYGYPVPLQQQTKPCPSKTVNPLFTNTPLDLKCIQSDLHLPEREGSYFEDMPVGDAVPSLVSIAPSSEELQWPR